MQINRRERMLILIGIPVIGVVLAFNFLVPPGATATKGGQVSLAEAEKRTKEAANTTRKIQADTVQLKPRIEQMSYSETAEELVPRVIRELQDTAEKSGVHLREIKPHRPAALPNNSGTRVPLEVHFRVPFQPNAIKFLYYVEDPAGKMVVEKMDITSADAKFKTVDVTAQITVFTRAPLKETGPAGGDTNDTKTKTDKS